MPANPTARELLDEIEKGLADPDNERVVQPAKARVLCAYVRELEAALRPFARYADGIGQFSGPQSPLSMGYESSVVGGRSLTESDFALAARTLGGSHDE